MTEYVEKFVINRRTYGIEKREEGDYRCWVGGCGIADRDSIGDARKTLHQYAISQNRAEVGSGQRMVDEANAALTRLGSDPFNLGRFRPKDSG